jgi:hypothetical protein
MKATRVVDVACRSSMNFQVNSWHQNNSNLTFKIIAQCSDSLED